MVESGTPALNRSRERRANTQSGYLMLFVWLLLAAVAVWAALSNAGGGPVDRCRTDHVDRMARLAETNGLAGPFVRVGEAAGRIIWRDAQGLEWALLVAKLREGLRDPARLLVIPEARVRASLAEGLDAPCPAR